ncbi:unannotated protein [freshwater metagenome]|uniref:Unannotated protein n=1 Tax=freshwater metagenome TaxID=449393 RepID=A0A6J7BDL9_9ZZZZ
MAIFGSVGPVISTHRSCRSAGAGATFQSALRISAVSGKKSSVAPAAIFARLVARIAISSSRRP